MKISVVIPTYNRADLVKDAIDSVLKQTFQAEEILLIDDGSYDNTKELLKAYKNDIHYIYQENKGVSAARNEGIRRAKNPWIAFLDSDDIWHEKKLERQVVLQKKNPHIHFFHTGERWMREGKRVAYPKSLKKPFGKCFIENIPTCKIAASSVLLKKSLFEELGGFDESLRVCEDYEMWLRLSRHYEIGLVDEELITKRAGHEQLSNSIFAIDAYHVDILKNHLQSEYEKEVKELIKKKCSILLKGAKKHNNEEIFKKYSQLLSSLS